MTTETVNGVDLYVQVQGSGERLVLVHGGWGDADNWGAVVGPLAERFEVVTFDRRGHSRSGDGSGPGSRLEDAADVAALIEHLGGGPAHVVGNSYGGSITLTLVASRPDLVASAVAHEPPLFAVLDGTDDPDVAAEVRGIRQRIDAVVRLLDSGHHEGGARRFVESVAFGPGSWERLPAALRRVFVSNAATFVDEQNDPAFFSIDAPALAAAAVPLLLTRGTESPSLFTAVIHRLATLVPAAEVGVLPGVGHVPQTTHPELFVANLLAFHNRLGTARAGWAP
ncbi:MAG: alpha/beta fold hydrolase [Acidimicrobiales bacterium]